ncbi:MAG TPA: xanthine dehydrogenase family protein molybdopterin-binding subunit, partial [Bradyrhizobium sp.]
MGGIGRSVRRLEDPPLLRGEGRFAADLQMPGQIHMRVVRSPVAFGRIEGIEIADALDAPGVLAVWTGSDVADIPPIDFRQMRVPGLGAYRQPILAQGMVRYVGEPMAVVFCDDPYRAEDAAELVFADIAELPPCLDATAAPGLFTPSPDNFSSGEDAPSNQGLGTEVAVIRKGYGDVAAAFAGAAHVVELELAVGRHTGVPLETRGALAVFNAARDVLELHGAAKVPHANRTFLAKMLGIALEGIHLFEGHVGGGFGIRGELYPEDVLVCLAAQRLHRPIKWIEDRREHLLAANHSRDQVHRIRAAVDGDGFVTAIDDEFWVDQGAYVRTHASTVADLTAGMLPGPYCIPAYRCAGHIRLTNKTPSGTYRAPGRYEGTFVRERLMDEIARRLALDRVTVRRRNLIPRSAIPFRRGIDALGTEVVYDSADFEGLLDRLIDAVDLPHLELRLQARRDAGELVGYGFGYFVEKSGLGPFDDVILSIGSDGAVEIITGVASVGQGVETALAQICETELGIAYDRMRVVHGQTDRIARGMGAFASRVTVMTGAAVTLASRKLRARLLTKASEILQTSHEALTIEGGMIRSAARGIGPSVSAGEAAAACAADDGTPCLTAEASFEAAHMTYPYGIHLAVVRIDRETCGIAVERFVVAYDVGRAVNPMLVEGQIAGGATQGIGGALYEAFIYADDGTPLVTSLADYLLPTAL